MKRLHFLMAAILFVVSSFAGSKDKVIKVDGHSYEIREAARKVVFVKCKKKAVNVSIPNQIEYKGRCYTVVEIGAGAFEGNQKLVSVIIPQNVTVLKDNSFMGCSALKEVKFGTEYISLHSGAFANCSSLSQISLPKNTKVDVGVHGSWGCFYRCTSLKVIVLPSSFDIINYVMFEGCSSLETIVINNPYCKIGKGAFDNCPSLQEIKVIHQWDGKGKIRLDGLHNKDGALYDNNNNLLWAPKGNKQ